MSRGHQQQAEPEYQEYMDADELADYREDGRSKKKFVSICGERLYAWLPPPVAPGKYPAGDHRGEPAMSGNYGPKPVPKAKASAGAGSSKPAPSGAGALGAEASRP